MTSVKIETIIKDILRERPISEKGFINFFYIPENKNYIETYPPVILDADQAYSVYLDRYNLQNKITKSNIIGYEYLLERLRLEKEKISIFPMNTKIGFIVVFYNNGKDLIGVLWNPTPQNLGTVSE